MKKVTNSKVDRVFVYGTLKRGFCNHVILQDNLFLGNATVKGHLVDVGPFPGLIGTDNWKNRVEGEVYLVDKNKLKVLDRLEGEGTLYLRKRIICRMTTNCKGQVYQGQKAKVVWTYFWNGNQDLPIVPTGNWQK